MSHGLGFGLCKAAGGAVQDTRADMAKQRAKEAELRQTLFEMEVALKEPPPAVRRAQIAVSELIVGEVLGEGQFGEVRAATYRGTPVAVKTMHERHSHVAKRAEAFRDEMQLLLGLRHPNIVQLVGGSWDLASGQMCLVLELCRGSLEDLLLDTDVPLGWMEELLPLATGIARGMAYLHAQKPPVIHRDLKPANVLLGPDLAPKIADMGSAMELEEGTEDLVAGSGSPLYQAPEVLRREQADELCDVWSYGCLLVCLSTREYNPYDPTPPAHALSLVSQLELAPSPPRGSPLAELIEETTAMEFEERPPFVEILADLESDATRGRVRIADVGAATSLRRAEEEMMRAEQQRTRTSSRGDKRPERPEAAAPTQNKSKGHMPPTARGLPEPNKGGGSQVEPQTSALLEMCGAAGTMIAMMTARSRKGSGASGRGGGALTRRRSSSGGGDRFPFPLGTRVRHATRGNGTVAELMADGRSCVRFDIDGDEHRYQKSSVHKLKPLEPAADPAPPTHAQAAGPTTSAGPLTASSLVSRPEMLLCQEDDWASRGETSPAGSSPGGVGGAAARGVATVRGDSTKPTAEQIAARKRARRASLKSADSSRSLFGHKEGPGRQVSERRESKLSEAQQCKSSLTCRDSGSSSSGCSIGGILPAAKGRAAAALNRIDSADESSADHEQPAAAPAASGERMPHCVVSRAQARPGGAARV